MTTTIRSTQFSGYEDYMTAIIARLRGPVANRGRIDLDDLRGHGTGDSQLAAAISLARNGSAGHTWERAIEIAEDNLKYASET